MALSIPQLASKLQSEADAYRFLEDLRWPDGEQVCPHCAVKRQHYFLKPSNGDARKTTRGSLSRRRVWKCAACRKQFSVLTGTIFHGSHIPVRTWVFVVFEMASSKNGVSAREIERKYDLTPKTAWYMCHRIREAMKREPMAGMLSGRIAVDETYVGGKPQNRHRNDPREKSGHRQRNQYLSDKAPVVSLISRETGEVRSRVMPTVTSATLLDAIAEHADPATTHLQTDGEIRYRRIANRFASHSTVNHWVNEWVRDGATTNQLENYFSQLKRSIDGTHHHVSVEHLHRYLAEFDFRYTTCKDTDTERMSKMVKRVAGRRMTYREPGRA